MMVEPQERDMSEGELGAWEETLYLMSIPGMKESIIEGMNTPLEECSDSLLWDDEEAEL
jgi:PHD/YefM family antitoxin component YafN of YafNO toxin-antitoxin module